MVGMPKSLPLALILAAVLTACAVGPDYRPAPAADVTARNLEAGHFAAAPPPSDWWQQFPDPLLGRLEDRALAANLDVAIAVEHVRAARAAFTEANLDYAPHVPLEAQYARSKEQQPGFTTDRINIASYTTRLRCSWELDLFRPRAAQRAGGRCAARRAAGDAGRHAGQCCCRSGRATTSSWRLRNASLGVAVKNIANSARRCG